MEAKSLGKDKYFIVIRGNARKKFYRGCIGHVEGEMPDGELMGLVYGGSTHAGSAKSGGVVKKEDTYPLSHHQAQLLLFVLPVSKRLELLSNPQLFSAICELSQDDLVVVKLKKGHSPGLVKNLMQIGRKDNKEDLQMLGFEVEFLDSDQRVSPVKPAPLPLFNAADIVQVIPAYSVSNGIRPSDNHSGVPYRKTASRVHTMPSNGSSTQQVKESKTDITQIYRHNELHVPLEVGSMVMVMSDTGIPLYGVIRWIGTPHGKISEWSGIELDYVVNGCSDGKYEGKRYFSCIGARALFLPLSKCKPDDRFLCNASEKNTFKPAELPIQDVPVENTEGNEPPISELLAKPLFVGRMKGIQGHYNSCYLDATLFSLFSSSMTLDTVFQRPTCSEKPICGTFREIVNRLRRQGFVPAESVMSFRKQLGCKTFIKEEKDPEEFITILLQQVLSIEPLLKLRSSEEMSQDAYIYQIILEKEQVGPVPTVQNLLETSFSSCDLKLEKIPHCLMVQMPRFGKMYKMFPYIIPTTELDITDLLYNSPRECFVCGNLAEFECPQCLPDRKLQPGKIKQYCTTCKTQVHTHPSRRRHSPRGLAVPAEVPSDSIVPKHTMQLFAILCIHTSHYVSFVKHGPGVQSWLFFDSMADRCGDDQTGYNIPEIRACPEVGDFLSQSEEELARAIPSQTGELVRRLLCDSYMCLYQAVATELANK